MKKFYTFAIAMTVAVSGYALSLKKAVTKLPYVANHSEVVEEKVPTLTPKALPQQAAAAPITSIDQLAGDYIWSFFGLTDEYFGLNEVEISLVVVDAAKGKMAVDTGQNITIYGYADLEAGTFTIPNRQKLMDMPGLGTIEFYFKDADETGFFIDGPSPIEALTGQITSTGISFDPYSIWTAGSPEDEDICFIMTYMNSLTMAGAEVIDEFDRGWTDYCTGTFVDGWIIPGFSDYNDNGQLVHLDPVEYPWEVKVQKSDSNPYLYRIYDPYHAETCPVLDGVVGGKGAIVFDVEDPDFVLVLPNIYSGYDNGANGLYMFNIEGIYTDMGATKEYISEKFNGFQASHVEGQTVIFHQCRFNFEGANDKVYYWSGAMELMNGSITLSEPLISGVEGVSAEVENAPAEYFNLQGIRVNEPSAGNVYIMRRGSRTSKIIMR